MLLQADGIVATRGAFTVHVDALHVERGEVLAVIGPNGAGKTTLFRVLALIDAPAAGTIRLDGRPVGPDDADARRRVAAVFQDPHLFAGTVASNVRIGLGARGVRRREAAARVDAILASLGIAALADVDARRVSGGEAQRVALARALVLEPDLLLLDEPAAALDAVVRARWLADLERLVREGDRGVVLVTHDPREAFALADRVAVLEEGAVRQAGTPSDLLAAPATPYVAALAGAELMLDAVVAEVDGDFATVVLAGGHVLVGLVPPGVTLVTGGAVHVAYRPEDVVLGPAAAFSGTSALNRLNVRVREVRHSPGGIVRARLDGPPSLIAVMSRRSAELLRVHPGSTLEAALKATALHVFPTAGASFVVPGNDRS